MVDLRLLVGLSFRIGYHRADNFTGAPLPGYGAPGAWLVAPAAGALVAALAELRRDGLGLCVFDAYRPLRAARAMAAHCRAGGLEHLLDGWVSEDSRHCRGVSVDVALAGPGGQPLDHGTPWDAFVPESRYGGVGGEPFARRRRLRRAMVTAGFDPYGGEWWHFELPLDPLPPPLDLPY